MLRVPVTMANCGVCGMPFCQSCVKDHLPCFLAGQRACCPGCGMNVRIMIGDHEVVLVEADCQAVHARDKQITKTLNAVPIHKLL